MPSVILCDQTDSNSPGHVPRNSDLFVRSSPPSFYPMKQFLIVLCLTGLALFAYVTYSGSKDSGTKAVAERPKLQQPGARNAQRPKSNTPRESVTKSVQNADGTVTNEVIDMPADQTQAAEKYLEAASASWRDMVTEDTLVRIEDRWEVDVSDVDFDADILISYKLPSGEQIDVSQHDWRRYFCLTKGRRMIEARALFYSGQAIAAEYGESFGFTDAQWKLFVEAQAEKFNLSVPAHLAKIVGDYGMPEGASMQARRDQIEGVLGFFPIVENTYLLPPMVQFGLKLEEDRTYLDQLLKGLATARLDMDKKENLASIANLLEPLSLILTDGTSENSFRRTWSFLDSDLPADAVVGCFVGDILTDTVLPPWLQPDGDTEYVRVDELYPLLEANKLELAEREQLLHDLLWFRILESIQVETGIALSPEEAWNIHADEVIARSKTAMSMTLIVAGFYEYPSMAHYRGVQRIFEGHKAALPENWQSEDTLRPFYKKHRVFVESWQPFLELILFSPRRLKGDMSVDWEAARAEAEDARTKILTGEIEFTSFRTKHHNEMKELFRKKVGDEAALSFEEEFRMGELGQSVKNQQQLLKETEYAKMMNPASVVRNAVVRLDRGELSPVWKSPVGYLLVRVNGAGLKDLEGEFEDFEDFTIYEYERTMFFQWVSEALNSSKRIVAN
ncbi:MAG: hypothetical protein ACI8TQ_000525 [Planctomycetota bacterium]|jgi:hypothetical protein